MLKNKIDTTIVQKEQQLFDEINEIVKQLEGTKVFKKICIKENYYKKRYLRKNDVDNKHIFKLSKIIKRKKLRGICVDKIQDKKDSSIMYYLYLLDNGKFCAIKVQPFKKKNTLKVQVSKTNINPSYEFGIKDKKGYELKYKWSIKRIENRIKNEIKNNSI